MRAERFPLSSFVCAAEEAGPTGPPKLSASFRRCRFRQQRQSTMSEKPTYLTRDGRARLETELEELITVGRKQVAERIAAAKELGDISESGEYEEAKNQ